VGNGVVLVLPDPDLEKLRPLREVPATENKGALLRMLRLFAYCTKWVPDSELRDIGNIEQNMERSKLTLYWRCHALRTRR